MPIQFRCPGCSQPIEVDDPFAGKSAQCPYCRRVITVPETTSLDAAAPIEARPSDSAGSLPPLPQSGGASHGYYNPTPDSYNRPAYEPRVTRPAIPQDRGRAGAAHLTGTIALALTGLTIVLFVACIAMMAPVFSHMARLGTSQPIAPTPQQYEQLFRDSGVNMNALALVSSGMQFCLIAGLILGVVSWWQQPRSNWRAWTSVGVNGVFVLCACSALVISIAVTAAGPR